MSFEFAPADAPAIPLHVIGQEEVESWTGSQPERVAGWVRAAGFSGALGATLLVPGLSRKTARR